MKLLPRKLALVQVPRPLPLAFAPRRPLPAPRAAVLPPRQLDVTYLRVEARGPWRGPLMPPSTRPPNALSSQEITWGAKTFIVRAQMLDRSGLQRLLLALSPRQFAFIRSNVFLPPQLQALHARLCAAITPPPSTPVRFALSALVRGNRIDKLSYLFPYFHLLAGSHGSPVGGSWFGVADARDARALVRLGQALQQGAEPVLRRAPQRALGAPVTAVTGRGAHPVAAP